MQKVLGDVNKSPEGNLYDSKDGKFKKKYFQLSKALQKSNEAFAKIREGKGADYSKLKLRVAKHVIQECNKEIVKLMKHQQDLDKMTALQHQQTGDNFVNLIASVKKILAEKFGVLGDTWDQTYRNKMKSNHKEMITYLSTNRSLRNLLMQSENQRENERAHMKKSTCEN